ncbi:MAG: DUF5615 family PIN-like protein [Deltaproteobacteria bacterium]|nr:DUF5615 family PIN-like protein [Deltaproteobacteria bacterium]MBW1793491.1 DUF5615 family PIN-like protein [Deltaproteobacteria bacterium]
MRTVKFYLDSDISRVSLRKGLLKAGIDVSWTPNDWMPENASDQMQLQEASLRGRCLVTHNIADFYRLHVERPDHYGIILAHQQGWQSGDILRALIRMVRNVSPDKLRGQIRWLNEWKV